MARALQSAWKAALRGAVVLLFAAQPGCYYLELTRGQLGVLWGRIPIERALARVDLDATERRQLAAIPDVLAFAHDTLHLAGEGSYRTFFDTRDGPASWNVVACARTRFEAHSWWFPIVGQAPYKGFFEQSAANAEAEALRARGLDARVNEVPAYSTLGWFDDPVFRSMLGGSDYWVVSTIFHELAHATVFRSGDATWNESMATFVGEAGAISYLEARFGKGSPEARAAHVSRHDDAKFLAFMHDLTTRLDQLYKSARTDPEKLRLRVEVFDDAKRRFERYRAETFLGGGYRGFARWELDNALMMGFRTYHADLALFEEVHHLTGDWSRTLAVFRAAADVPKPFAHLFAWSQRLRLGLPVRQDAAPPIVKRRLRRR